MWRLGRPGWCYLDLCGCFGACGASGGRRAMGV